MRLYAIDPYGRETQWIPVAHYIIDADHIGVEYLFGGSETENPTTYTLRVEIETDVGVLRKTPETLVVSAFEKRAI